MKHAVSFSEKLFAVMHRDLVSASRYSVGFGMQFFILLFELASAYYLAKAIGPAFRPEGTDYYWYLLIGTAFLDLMMSTMAMFVRQVEDAQNTGTMEVMMTTATKPLAVVILGVLSTLSARVVHLIVYFSLGIYLADSAIPSPSWPVVIVVLLLSIALILAVGLLASAFQILAFRGAAIIWLASLGAGLFTGVMFPVSVLPAFLQTIAHFNPFFYALSALRQALLHGSEPALLSPLMMLAAITAVFLPLSVFTFRFALQKARQSGSLSYY